MFWKECCNGVFLGVVSMKGWRAELSSRKMLCYYIFPSASQRTLHSSVFHFISYLTDHQIQIIKRENWERFPHIKFPHSSVLYLRDTCFDLLDFSFLIIWKNQRVILLVLVIFASQQKKSKRKKKYNLMIESLLSS